MWIRSKDKKLLVRPRSIYVDVLDDGQVTLVCTTDECGDMFVLGSYACEEDAVRELDAIIGWIDLGHSTFVYLI